MAHPSRNNVGHLVQVKVGLVPIASAGATRNGTGFDRTGFDSCVLVGELGAATGTPTSFTYDLKIQHSDVVGSGYADYTPPSGTASLTQQTAGSVVVEKDIDLSAAKQFIRVVEVVAFVGGTSPTLPCSAVLVMGGAEELPATLP
jgi:hypothetical protein